MVVVVAGHEPRIGPIFRQCRDGELASIPHGSHRKYASHFRRPTAVVPAFVGLSLKKMAGREVLD
jgi:hypothetical protein